MCKSKKVFVSIMPVQKYFNTYTQQLATEQLRADRDSSRMEGDAASTSTSVYHDTYNKLMTFLVDEFIGIKYMDIQALYIWMLKYLKRPMYFLYSTSCRQVDQDLSSMEQGSDLQRLSNVEKNRVYPRPREWTTWLQGSISTTALQYRESFSARYAYERI